MECWHCGKDINSASGGFCPHCGMAVKEPTKSDLYFANNEKEQTTNSILWMYIIVGLLFTFPMLPLLREVKYNGFVGGTILVLCVAAIPLLLIFLIVLAKRSESRTKNVPLMIRAVAVHEKWTRISSDSEFGPLIPLGNISFISPDRELLKFTVPQIKDIPWRKECHELEEGERVILHYKKIGQNYVYCRHEPIDRQRDE